MHGPLLAAVAFFREHLDDLRFWRVLLEGLEEVVYMKGEFLVREGEVPDGMYLLKEGTLEVISEPAAPSGLIADWNQGPSDPNASADTVS
ncbi:hypothetical protein T484DRAFT_1871419 [Baffinella frigidus]|nr:hypothetical protein T484DRAFT_1871419 [Cryptophyta sp. CCMP2293]